MIALSVLGLFVTSAALISPRYLSATQSDEIVPIEARLPMHQETIELLGSIISRSHATLAVHDRIDSPFLEIVLWVEDRESLDVIEPAELAVISHSETMQTISFYAVEEEEAAEDDDSSEPVTSVDRSLVSEPAFCRVWRERDDVRPRIIATGVSHMQLKRLATSENLRARLHLSLTWAPDSSDGSDEASVLLDVALTKAGDV